MSVMESVEILEHLPHRYPMVLVDRILELDVEAKTVVGMKSVSFNEPFFQGHFPGRPVMPGVLQLEAMAQTGGVLINVMINRPGAIAYFTGVNKAKFKRIVKPGDQLRMELGVTRMKMGTAILHGIATVDGKLVCVADMSFFMERE